MNMINEKNLEEKITLLPTGPGVYLMKNENNKVIYVGKAKNIKNRVSTYFHKSGHSIKTRALVAEIRDIELILTKTEVEALLLNEL